jgi:hypothetical protein
VTRSSTFAPSLCRVPLASGDEYAAAGVKMYRPTVTARVEGSFSALAPERGEEKSLAFVIVR